MRRVTLQEEGNYFIEEATSKHTSGSNSAIFTSKGKAEQVNFPMYIFRQYTEIGSKHFSLLPQTGTSNMPCYWWLHTLACLRLNKLYGIASASCNLRTL